MGRKSLAKKLFPKVKVTKEETVRMEPLKVSHGNDIGAYVWPKFDHLEGTEGVDPNQLKLFPNV